MKIEPINYENGGIKFTILVKNKYYHLDFYRPATGAFENKTAKERRVRRAAKKKVGTTLVKLSVNKENLAYLKTVIIPDIVMVLGKEPTIRNDEKEYTFDQYAQKFFEIEKQRISKESHRNQKRYYYKHIYPYFSKRLIGTISHADLKDWQHIKMTQTSSFRKKKYSRGTVQLWRSIINKILNAAVDDELLEKNHFTKVPTPKSLKYVEEEQKEKEVTPFTQQELKKIISYPYKNKQVKNFILVLYGIGIRPGEAIALEPSDVDWDREVIHITKTRQEGKDGTPKTKASIREINLYANAFNSLKEQLKLTNGKEKIFTNKQGKALRNHQNFSYALKIALNSLGIEGNLYTLRHTFASTHVSLPKADLLLVSSEMGHEDLSTTLKKYAKFIKNDDETRLSKKRVTDREIDIL